MKITLVAFLALLASPVVADNGEGVGTRGHQNRVLEGTPDGDTPAEETVCDVYKGFGGPLYGLCVSRCEAQDCDAGDVCGIPCKAFDKAFPDDCEIPCPGGDSSDPICPCFDADDVTEYINSGDGDACVYVLLGSGNIAVFPDPPTCDEFNAIDFAAFLSAFGGPEQGTCSDGEGGVDDLITPTEFAGCAFLIVQAVQASVEKVPVCDYSDCDSPNDPTSAPSSGPTELTCPCFDEQDIADQLAKDSDTCLEITSGGELYVFSARGNSNSNFAMVLDSGSTPPTCSFKSNGAFFVPLTAQQVDFCETAIKGAQACPTAEPTAEPSSAPTQTVGSCPCFGADDIAEIKQNMNACFEQLSGPAFDDYFVYKNGKDPTQPVVVIPDLVLNDWTRGDSDTQNKCRMRPNDFTRGISEAEVAACETLMREVPTCSAVPSCPCFGQDEIDAIKQNPNACYLVETDGPAFDSYRVYGNGGAAVNNLADINVNDWKVNDGVSQNSCLFGNRPSDPSLKYVLGISEPELAACVTLVEEVTPCP